MDTLVDDFVGADLSPVWATGMHGGSVTIMTSGVVYGRSMLAAIQRAREDLRAVDRGRRPTSDAVYWQQLYAERARRG